MPGPVVAPNGNADAGRALAQHDAGADEEDGGDEEDDERDDSGPASMGTPGTSPSRPGTGAVTTPATGSLVGTWVGTQSGPSGQFAASYTISSAGYFVMRGKELLPGRPIQYVPSGGGVRTITLISRSGGGSQLQMVVQTSFEKSSDGNLDQQTIEDSYQFTLTSSGLQATLSERSVSRFGDGNVSSSASGEQTWTGLLQRQ
jgi:hypothetical protein